MEIVLVILVFLLAGFCAYLYTKVMALETRENQGMSDNEHNQLMSIVDNEISRQIKEHNTNVARDIDKRDETMRVRVDEQFDKLVTDTTKYVDNRIKGLNDKFFKVVNLDS